MDNTDTTNKMQKAIFAAGCFWGVEEAFRKIPGVTHVRVGYTGGKTEHPTYEDVCAGHTGHAEAVELTFNPHDVSYRELLEVFFSMHDPTQKDGQGFDIGNQYRSEIFYLTDEQKRQAEGLWEELRASGKYQNELHTKITPAGPFFEAEEYHQQYLAKKKNKSRS